MDRTKDIINKVNAISGSKPPYNVFTDWIKLYAIAIMQSVRFKVEREEEYLNVIKNYNADDITELCTMLSETAGVNMTDVLGNVFMESGWGNKNTGQFYTPWAVNSASAKIIVGGINKNKGYIRLYEPTAGAGGMIIAAAKELQDKGINYQRKLKVIAQDLDINSFYMCYVQLSLYGIDAKVVQCDALENKPFNSLYNNVFLTPMFMLNGALW